MLEFNIKSQRPLFSNTVLASVDSSPLWINQLIFDPATNVEEVDQILIVDGTTSFLEFQNINAILKIAESEDVISLYLDVSFPSDTRLIIPYVSLFSVIAKSISIKIDILNPDIQISTGKIDGRIIFNNGERIDIEFDLPNGDQDWILKANLTEICPLSILSGVLEELDLESILDPIKPIADNLELLEITNLEIAVNPIEKQVSSIYLILIMPEEPKLMGMEIKDVRIYVDILKPLVAEEREVLCNLAGTIFIGSVGLDFEASMPRLMLQGCLAEGSTINLSELARGLAPGVTDNLPEIAFHDVRATIDIEENSFSIYARSYGEWDLEFLKIDALYLDLIITRTLEGRNEVTGSMGGSASIGDNSVSLDAQIPGNFVLGGKIPKINLSEIVEQFLPGFEGLPDLKFVDLDIFVTPKTGEFSFSGSSASPWSIPLDFETAEISDVLLSLNRTVDAATQQKKVSGEIKGTMKLGESSFDIDYKFPGDFVLQGRITQMNLLGLTEQLLQGLGVPDDLPDLVFKDIDIFINPQKGEFNISGRSSSSWPLPLGSQGMQVGDIFLQASRSAKAGAASQISGRISGTVIIAGTSVTVDMQMQKGGLVLSGKVDRLKFSSLVQDLCGNQAAQNTLMPPGVQALDITDLDIFLDVSQKTFSASCKSGHGEVELMVKTVETTWGFICGLVPPQNWKFSAISQELKSLDDINFHDTAVIVSSTDDASFSLTKVQAPRKDMKIIRGLNLFFGMDLSSLKAEKILGKTDLEIYAAVGSKISDLVLETKLAGEIKLAEGLILGGVIFRLVPNPANFSLQLLCVLIAKLKDSDLKFTGAIIIEGRSASMAATMQGVWDKPFGFSGVAIANVALNLGFSYPVALPKVGIAGALQVGDFKGSAAIMFDPGAPTKSMVAVDFNRLYFIDILKTFCSASVWGSIPEDVIRTVLNIGFEDSKVYIVPQATQIGELKYEQGFRLSSKLIFMGLRGYADLKIDNLKGISVEGDIDVINLGGIFILRGANGKPKPAMKLSVIPSTIPVIYLNGEVSLLGLSSSVDVLFSKEGFSIKIEGKIFNLFQAYLEVSGDITKSQGIYVKADLKNDLFEYIKEKALKFIKDITQSGVSKLTNAQEEISIAKVEVDRLLAKRSEMRVTINNEKEKAREGLQSAQWKLTEAQNKVNSLQNEINQSKDRIRSYENDIRWWNSWYDNSSWWEKTYLWAQLAYEVGWRGAAIAGLYIKIGAIEAAKLIAIGVLEAAKFFLRGLEDITKIPVDMDPRILALTVSHAAATAALDVANWALELLKKALGGMASVATFIINAGLGGIIDIRGAQFEGLLSLSSGAKISLRIDVTFMNGPVQTYQLDFDFKNPISAVESLVKRALPGG